MISFLTKMYIRYLGLGLLIWFPGALHAQHATPCSAPRLDDGFFSPKKETYSHETQLTYTCNDGHKPTVKGWWATSTCQNDTWSPEPQCIDEEACIAPDIPNANYIAHQRGWYEDGEKIRIKCNEGYEPKDQIITTTCINGTWDSVPVCEKSIHACGEPPQIPHAVIILQGYQDFFAAETTVQYECEDGYTVEGAVNNKSVHCIAGSWTEGPVCSRGTRPGTGPVGSAVGGTGSGPGTEHGGSGGHPGSGTQPEGGVNYCGKHPVVPDADVVEKSEMSLRYQCGTFYKLVGPETVVCNSDGTWSKVPTCKANFCSVDTAQYPQLIHAGVKYIRDGETEELECVKKFGQFRYQYSLGLCTDGIISLSKCCARWERDTIFC